jgi:hypothetical protein
MSSNSALLMFIMQLGPAVTSSFLSVFYCYGSAENGLKNSFSEPILIGVPG